MGAGNACRGPFCAELSCNDNQDNDGDGLVDCADGDCFAQVCERANGISGMTRAGATLEAINLTTAPRGRYHTDDTFVFGKADATGKFTGAKLSTEWRFDSSTILRQPSSWVSPAQPIGRARP